VFEVDLAPTLGILGAGTHGRGLWEILVSVHTPPVVTPPTNQTATEGQGGTFNLGSFTDPDSSPYQVDVNWGDGSAHTTFSQGTPGSLGTAPHSYTEDGTKTVSVKVTNSAGQSDSKTFTIGVSDAALTANGQTVAGTEGSSLGGPVVATFSDGNPNPDLADFSATIDWGDGVNVSAGTITPNGDGTFSVSGDNMYHLAGTYTITVQINDAGGSTITTTGTANIADAALSPAGFDQSATQGVPQVFTVAEFDDPNPLAQVGDFSANITWGDGSPIDSGTITQPGGPGTTSSSASNTRTTILGNSHSYGHL
jgi:hypothetical protein